MLVFLAFTRIVRYNTQRKEVFGSPYLSSGDVCIRGNAALSAAYTKDSNFCTGWGMLFRPESRFILKCYSFQNVIPPKKHRFCRNPHSIVAAAILKR